MPCLSLFYEDRSHCTQQFPVILANKLRAAIKIEREKEVVPHVVASKIRVASPALSNILCCLWGMWHVACDPYLFLALEFFALIFFFFIVRFAFLALTEMERTFPENVVPGWLWSLQRRGWGVRNAARGA